MRGSLRRFFVVFRQSERKRTTTNEQHKAEKNTHGVRMRGILRKVCPRRVGKGQGGRMPPDAAGGEQGAPDTKPSAEEGPAAPRPKAGQPRANRSDAEGEWTQHAAMTTFGGTSPTTVPPQLQNRPCTARVSPALSCVGRCKLCIGVIISTPVILNGGLIYKKHRLNTMYLSGIF